MSLRNKCFFFFAKECEIFLCELRSVCDGHWTVQWYSEMKLCLGSLTTGSEIIRLVNMIRSYMSFIWSFIVSTKWVSLFVRFLIEVTLTLICDPIVQSDAIEWNMKFCPNWIPTAQPHKKIIYYAIIYSQIAKHISYEHLRVD